ncbi:MAG TPA: nucleoside-diphosphate kinase, partial [Candidatus Paceibacterota bacterium]|nr:nucleoside-diphosphate kinase [Candidatus Paceibacterota bacterium]
MAHVKEEKTLIILKPDAMHRGLAGEVISRFERKGLKIVGMKMVQLEDAIIDAHYVHIKDKPFFVGIKNFMKTSPVIVMVLAGINAVDATRLIVGPTKAYEASAGTIRGDLSLSTQSNIVHASDSIESGRIEVERF